MGGPVMKNLTRNGIAKDLSKSPYIFTVVIDDNKLDLYFSSKLHLNKFVQKRSENYAMIYNYLYKRFKVQENCVMLSDLNLYNKIENRGYYIKLNGEIFRCNNKIVLSGGYKMSKNLEEWHGISTISYAD